MGKSGIVFIHQLTNWFLPYALRQALYFEKELPVILLGDRRPSAPVQFHVFQDLEIDDRALEFERNYEHMSTNSPWFELTCWMRWFRLLSFLRREKMDSVFHHDSDVLIQTSSSFIHQIYGADLSYAGYVITGKNDTASGHTSFWTRQALEDFCEFILYSFKDPAYRRRYRAHFDGRQSQGLEGGVCDMTSLDYFWEANQTRIANLAEVRQGCTFDANLNRSANLFEEEYVTRGGQKEIILDGLGQPFFKRRSDGTLVRALTLHFQGGSKLQMAGAYRGPFFLSKPIFDLRTKVKTFRQKRQKRLAAKSKA